MKVLVTGHLGYIGAVMVPMLQEAGFDITGLDSDLYRNCTFLNKPVKIKEKIKDIRDIDHKDVEGFDAIIHLAALSNDPLGNLNPNLTYDINLHASVKLAQLSKEVGVDRYLFSSSCSLYGAAGNRIMDESAPFNPVTPYGESKIKVEQEVSKLADKNFSPVFMRNTTAYGLSPRLRFDIVVNNLVAWAYTTKRIYLKSDGSPWRPLVHISDISRAFIEVLKAPRKIIHNQAFNVGINAENYQIKDIAEMVKDVVPGCTIEYAEDAGPDKRSYQVDFTKLKNTFPGYKPEWTVRKGIEELYDAYQGVKFTPDDFEGPRFKRIAQIAMLLDEKKLDLNLRWIN